MLNFLRTICSGAISGASGSSGAPSGSGNIVADTNAIIPALEILWKGMLGIFVVCALIFLTVKILNKLPSKKK